jgi:hypothetical protein
MAVLTSSTESLPATQLIDSSEYEPRGTELGSILKADKYKVVEDVRFTQAYPELSLCKCFPEKVRTCLEVKALPRASALYPRDEPLEIVSFGSGGCLQELIYLSRMQDMGFSKLSVTLIDGKYRTDQNSPDQLRQFAERELENRVEVNAHENLLAYLKERDRKVSALIMMIDLANYYEQFEVGGVKKKGRLIDYGLNMCLGAEFFPENSLLVYNAKERQQKDILHTLTIKERRTYYVPEMFDLNEL